MTRSPLIKHFAQLDDPRSSKNKKHLLVDIVVIVLSGVLAGFDDFENIAEFAKAKEAFFKTFLRLPFGVPSHDTLNDVFARLRPEAFLACFTAWIAEVAEVTAGEVIAIDGKTLRRSFDRASAKAAIHMVSAWACANGISLGQVKVDDKSNEITAIPKLLELLCIKGCIVTVDAIGCQKAICESITAAQADYCIALKENQPGLYGAAQDFFELHEPLASSTATPYEASVTRDKGHGRQERRSYFITSDIDPIIEEFSWPGLKSLGMVRSTRIQGKQVSYEERYYICSFSADAEKFARAVRGHWSVENSLHWQLDVNMGEDDSRLRKKNSAENMAHLRRLAINLLKRETSIKKSLNVKRTWCSSSEDYLLKVLTSQ